MVRGQHALNVLYIRVQISSVARVLVHKCDSGMLHGAGVNHHVPGIAIQSLRPAVVALKWKAATNCCYNFYKPYVGSPADDGYSQVQVNQVKAKLFHGSKKRVP